MKYGNVLTRERTGNIGKGTGGFTNAGILSFNSSAENAP